MSTWRYSKKPLSAYGSTIGAGGRFNTGNAADNVAPSAFPALYIAENGRVAHREFFGMNASDRRGLSPKELTRLSDRDYVSTQVNGVLHKIVDISNSGKLAGIAAVLSKFSVSDDIQELAVKAGIRPRSLVLSVDQLVATLQEVKWRGWPTQFGIPSNSQVFGKLVWEAGYDGILFRSTKRGGRCLAIYPQNFAHGDSAVWLAGNAPPGTVTKIDSENWELATEP